MPPQAGYYLHHFTVASTKRCNAQTPRSQVVQVQTSPTNTRSRNSKQTTRSLFTRNTKVSLCSCLCSLVVVKLPWAKQSSTDILKAKSIISWCSHNFLQVKNNRKHLLHTCHNSTWKPSAIAKSKTLFFCWRLLGLIPGGAPFSQLNKGVKDAMVESTDLVECQFMTKTCKKAIIWKTKYYAQKEKKEGNHPQLSDRIAEEGSGEVIQTAPTPEQQRKRHR